MSDEETQLEELRRLVAAKKVVAAKKLRAGEDVAAGELDRIARLEERIRTREQFNRLRDLTRQPGLAQPVIDAVVGRATTKKRKGSRASGTKTKAD